MTSQNRAAVEYQPAIVSFIDILGFRHLIQTSTAEEIRARISSLQEFTAPPQIGFIKTSETSIGRALSQSVSDAIVRVRPFITKYRDGAFFSELYNLLHAQVELIMQSIFIRGGVTIGNVCFEEEAHSPIFGPAMVRAYEIESQEAIFPRIVVDEHAIAEHRRNPQLRAEHNTVEYELLAIETLLATGEDGTRYIDYLRAIESEFDHFGDYLDFLIHHRKLIVTARAQKMDPRTSRKYEWLMRYHNTVVAALHTRFSQSNEARRSFESEFETEALPFFDELLIT